MTLTKAWPIFAVLAIGPLIQSCDADKRCLYEPPQAGEVVEDLTSDLATLPGSTGCEAIDLEFRRRSDGAFLAVARLHEGTEQACTGIAGESVVITSSRGTVSEVQDHGAGVYSALVTPDQKKTGEYLVTASASPEGSPLKKSRTAVVFDRVDKRWGQPQMVEGLVNTLGWEDSAYISADGEYLYIMYLSISPSCLLEEKDDDPRCHRVPGKVSEQNRPGFASHFAAGRLHEDGAFENQCTAVESVYTRDLFDKYDVYVPPMMAYGFRRQADNSFAEPFPVTIDGVDACVAPSGLEAQAVDGNRAVALMGLVDPASWNTPQKDDYPSLYTATIQVGKPNVLATWQPSKKQLEIGDSGLQVLFGEPLKNRQDNPHAVINPKTKRIEAVFWDSEHYDEDIFYRLLLPGGQFPEGPWGPVQKTPVFSTPGVTEIQPFFDGRVLSVHKRYELASHDFLGDSFADISDPEAWGPERTELAVCEHLKGDETGVLYAAGDPTYARRNGKTALYFVYLTRRENGLLDFNIGFVEEK